VLPAHVTGATLLLLLCAVSYVWLEPLAGGFAALVYALLLSSAQRFYATTPNALAIAGFVHALSWFMQLVPGHMLCEQRKPALADSLFASLILAPFFVVMEVRPASAARIYVACRVLRGVARGAWRVAAHSQRGLTSRLQVLFFLGYRPALHAELRARISKAVGKLRAKDRAA
jgi:uncharacterized membrane protein YGL010W